MLGFIKTKIISVARQAARSELEGKSITFASARAMLQTYDMRLNDLETKLFTRIDDLEQQISALRAHLKDQDD